MPATAPDGSHPALRRGLRVDRLGTEVVVLDPASSLVHRLTGPAAEVVNDVVMRGVAVDELPARLAPAVAGLRVAGVLRGDVPRRRALGAVAAGTVGILTLALPSAFAAASTGGSGGGGGGADESTTGSTDLPPGLVAAPGYTYRAYTSTDPATFVVAGAPLTVDVLLIGGGGDGGTVAGGGGAGGAVSLYSGRSLAPASYTVSVGAAGGTSQMGGIGGGGTAGTAAGGGPGMGSAGVGGASSAGVGGSAGGAGGSGSGSSGGGGGGAGGNGAAAAFMEGGAGGAAFEVSSFFAIPTVFGGGGGGGGYDNGGAAGIGGGAGGNGYGGAPESAPGFGGGGGGGYDGGDAGGAGGGGLVVVRYPTV